MLTLMPTGTPASGATSSPRAIAWSTCRARASTSPGRHSTTALSAGFALSSRASADCATSVAETFRKATRLAIWLAESFQRSVVAVMGRKPAAFRPPRQGPLLDVEHQAGGGGMRVQGAVGPVQPALGGGELPAAVHDLALGAHPRRP